MSKQNTIRKSCALHTHTKYIPPGTTFDLVLTFHSEDTTAEVFEVDPAMKVGVQTFFQLLHLCEK